MWQENSDQWITIRYFRNSLLVCSHVTFFSDHLLIIEPPPIQISNGSFPILAVFTVNLRLIRLLQYRARLLKSRLMVTWARLFKSRLTLTWGQKLTEVSVSLVKKRIHG